MNRVAIAAAVTALFVSGAAAAQPRPQLSPQATQAAVRYALPHLLSSVRSTCAPKLSPSGYLAKNGQTLLARYSQGSQAAWPAAKNALLEMGGKQNAEMARMIGQMPDSALKPFVDATITSMVASKLKLENCGDVERGLELLAPLPAENVAGIAGFLFEIAERDRKPKGANGG